MKNFKKTPVIFYSLVSIIGLIFIWRAFYGVNYNDEMYYADCLYRLYQGDIYLADDWHMHVMSCIPIYPFYVLFRLINGSNEGVILYLRMLYTFFQLSVACICFLRLRRSGIGALFVCLIYLLFTPYNIAAMSYNTMGIGFAMLTFAILSTPKKHSRIAYMTCGICFAFYILSAPFAVFIYLLYAAACIIQFFLCRGKRRPGFEEFSLSSFFWLTAGAFLIFLIFGFMLFQRSSLAELKLTFLYNFDMSGYEQTPSQWAAKFFGYFDKIYKYYPYLIWYMGLSSVFLIFDKKRFTHRLWYLVPCACLVLYYLYTYGTQTHVPVNFCVMPLAFLGFLCFFLLPEKNWKYFFFWFIPGALYSLCSHFASDTGILCITSSFVLCSSIGALFLTDCCRTCIANSRGWIAEKAAAGCIVLVLSAHILISGYLRITFFYNEAPLPELTEQIHIGPARGIYTTQGMAYFHSDRVRKLQSLNLTEKDTLLVLGMEPWAYLCTDASFAMYSCWDNYDEYLYQVYLLFFPEKYPSVIYSTNLEKDLAEKPFLTEVLAKNYQIIDLDTANAIVKPEH